MSDAVVVEAGLGVRGYEGEFEQLGWDDGDSIGSGLESKWREMAAMLEPEQLVTEAWLGLERAIEAAWVGYGHAAFHWLDRMEARYQKSWESYQSLKLLEDEITQESILGHLFLQEGAEHWLEALAALREFCAEPEAGLERKVLEHAEEGQRLLLALQLVEAEQRWSDGAR